MNTAKKLGIAAILIYGYTIISKKIAAGRLNFYPDSITDVHFDGLRPVVTIALRVQNTSNQTFTIRSIAGNLIANNYVVGNVSLFDTVLIPQNSESILYVDIKLGLLQIVNDLMRSWSANNFSQTIKFNGDVNVDKLQIPLKLEFTGHE